MRRLWIAAGALVLPAGAAAQQSADEMALVSAAQDCRVDEARQLIERGVEVDAANSGGYTPLMMTASYGCTEVARLLIEAGADTSLRHPTFGTALELARMNRYAAIEALLEAGGAFDPAAAGPEPVAPEFAAPIFEPTAPEQAEDTIEPTGPQAGAPAGGRAWPLLGVYRPGQEVLYSGTAGKTWQRGTIRSIDPVYGYNIEGVTGSYDPFFVVATAREPFWSEFFIGDWRVSVPMAMGTVTDGTSLYRTVSGGMRLPPLRIAADGSYSWRVQEGSGERVIQGRWIPNPEGPGIILQSGEQGADWLVYNNSRTGSELGETVIIASDCCTPYDGARLD